MLKKEENRVFINWRKLEGDYLITNDFGFFEYLSPSDFNKYQENNISEKLKEKLKPKAFIRTCLDFDALSKRYNNYYFNRSNPLLHILVLNSTCNENCIYCQSRASYENNIGISKMKWETAKKSIDFSFDKVVFPNQQFTIEFQGGEPLLNWEVLKKAITYIRGKENNNNKKVKISLVTNMSLMDNDKADFLLRNKVSICTSLDGPKKLHDKNRPYINNSSYEEVKKWLSFFNKKYNSQDNEQLDYPIYKPSALLTVSRYSLNYPQEIVDEYLEQGLDNIFVRPLSIIGYSAKNWNEIGYTAEDFVKFYEKVLKYILYLQINKKKYIREKFASILLKKILKFESPNYVDLCSPCGAGTMQMVYDIDGKIYTCDEARMLEPNEKKKFQIGNVFASNSLSDIIEQDSVKACAMGSNLENRFVCFRCVYKPYCGICPVLNYSLTKNIDNSMNNFYCEIKKGIFDILFKLLRNKTYYEVFKEWTDERN